MTIPSKAKPPGPTVPPDPQRESIDRSFGQRPRLIASSTIGNSDTHDENRRVDQGLKDGHWHGFVDGVVQTSIDNGFERHALHNPFGTLAGQQMKAGQYLEAKAAGLTWLTDGFVEAWKPITARFEVIAYQGSIKHDATFEQEWRAGSRSFAAYVRSAYQPIIDAGMVPAFDAHQHLSYGHWAIAAHRYVTQMTKGKGYFEPGPANGDWHWFKSGCHIWIANDNSTIVHEREEDWQLKPVPDGTETVLQLCMAPGDIIRGEKYNVPAEYMELWEGCEWHNYPTWIRRFCQYHFERGRTVAVNPRNFHQHGLKVKDVTAVTS